MKKLKFEPWCDIIPDSCSMVVHGGPNSICYPDHFCDFTDVYSGIFEYDIKPDEEYHVKLEVFFVPEEEDPDNNFNIVCICDIWLDVIFKGHDELRLLFEKDGYLKVRIKEGEVYEGEYR